VSPDDADRLDQQSVDQTPARGEPGGESGRIASAQVMTATLIPAANCCALPYRWTDDGQLLIVKCRPASAVLLYRAIARCTYDPATGEIKPLYRPETAFRLCLSESRLT
jgi:hypothetical protein